MGQNDKKKIIELTKKLISINSISGRENEVIEFIENFLSDRGFITERQEVEERYNLFAYRGKSSYLIATHVDTVPAWTYRRAFYPRYGRGKICGRGAVDTKGQISSLLVAVENCNSPCALAFFVDEEKEGKGSEVFSPKFKFEGAVILEPTDFKICTRQAGSIEFLLEVRGKSSHGAIPGEGKNAIEEFFRIYRKIKNMSHLKNKPADFKHSGVNLGWIRGGVDCQLTPRICRGKIDIPVYPGNDREKVKGELENLIKQHEASMEITVFDKPIEVSREEKVVKLLERAIKGIRKTEFSGMPAWTDAANLIEKKIPSIIFGAGNLGIAHTERECISVRDQIDLCKILQRFIEFSGNESNIPAPPHF